MSFTWEGKQLENRRLVNDYTNEVYVLAESPVSGLGVSTKIITLQLVSDMSQGSLRFPGLPVSTKPYEKRKGKQHEIFEPSFDWKECTSEKFIIQKLNYIHENPCQGKWQLALAPQAYKHSSAKFYVEEEHLHYPVTSYEELQDIDLTKWIEG